MQLFELTKAIFNNKKWDSVSRGDKKKNHFMVSRMLSIQFPIQGQALNHIKIDPVATIDAWHNFMIKLYDKVPFWMYTKGQKKRKEEKQKKLNIKESTIKKYASEYRLDLKSVKDAIKFFPEKSLAELKKFEKLIS